MSYRGDGRQGRQPEGPGEQTEFIEQRRAHRAPTGDEPTVAVPSWGRPDAPWGPAGASPAGQPGEHPGSETAIIYRGYPEPGDEPGQGDDGGTNVPIYFRAQFDPQPPSVVTRIAVIYGLTVVLQALLFAIFSGPVTDAHPLQDMLWRVATGVLAVSLVPAISGVLVDKPKSVWSKRLLNLVYMGCVLVLTCDIASLYQRFT